jgi:type I restriction-modification system DNA methylase subunit
VAYENNDKKMESIYSKRIRAGKRRTYFFDVRATRGNDYYLTITESRKRFDDNGYDRHKIFLYKEDFNKFIKALGESVDYVKTELMPDFDFDAFNHDENQEEVNTNGASHNDEVVVDVAAEKMEEEIPVTASVAATASDDAQTAKTEEEVDKW